MMKIKFWIGGLLLAGLAGWAIWRGVEGRGGKTAPGGRGGSRAVSVRVEPVRREALADEGEFTGSLLPRAQFDVASKVPGRVVRILAQLGDPVTNGALVALLDSDEYEQEVAQSRAELEVTRASLQESRIAMESADRDFRRIKTLREQKIAAEAELDEAQSRVEAAEAKGQWAEAQVRQREAALRTAEVRLGYTRIRAVWEGAAAETRRVSHRFVDEGTTLRANDPILTVIDRDIVLAVIHVIERDYPRIREGQGVIVQTDAYPGRIFEGRVVRRAPVLREASRQARVEIEVPNAEEALAPGLFVRVRIRFEERSNVQTVSAAALVRRGGKIGVFQVDGPAGTVSFISVRTGIEQGGRIEIMDPELTGDVVVLGQHLLEDGAAVRIAESGSPSSIP
jgi:RND family efflux transporter MFP subunit